MNEAGNPDCLRPRLIGGLVIGQFKSIRQQWAGKEELRFLVVGAVNTLVAYLIFTAIYLLFGKTLHYLLVALVSHFLSVTFAYFMQRTIVFRSKQGVWLEFFRYNLSVLAVLGVQMAGLYVLVSVIDLHPLASQAMVVLLSVIVSYILHRLYSFKSVNRREHKEFD